MIVKTYEYYIFIKELNEIIKNNILKLPNSHIILNFKICSDSVSEQTQRIIKFCKCYKIPFYVPDNVKIAKKLKADGIFVSANNKRINLISINRIKFNIIGSAHNQLEYFFKSRQDCKVIMLSPIFYNKKHSIYKILNPIKFNLICLNWRTNIGALGGILKNNINKINLTKAKCIGIQSYIKKVL